MNNFYNFSEVNLNDFIEDRDVEVEVGDEYYSIVAKMMIQKRKNKVVWSLILVYFVYLCLLLAHIFLYLIIYLFWIVDVYFESVTCYPGH